MKKYLILMFMILVLICCNTSSGRSEIEETIYSAVSAVEERDVDEFMKIISIEYLDEEERAREDIEDKVKTYLNRFRGISVYILNIKTVKKNMNSAEVITEISFSRGLGKIFSKIVNSYGEVYRFNISMTRRSKTWVVKSAEWSWLSIDELYPESLKVLRELFPNTF